MNAVAFNTSSSNLTNGSTLTSGLVGHWTFDGPDITTSILDKSGNGNNGGFGGGSTSSAKVAGKLGQGLQFDGVNDYVDMGNPASLQTTGDLTLSVWIKPTSFPGTDDNTVLMKAGPGDCAYKMDVTRDSSGGAPGLQHFYMFVTSDNNRCVPGAGTGAQRYNTTMLATSTWNHIVGVYRAGTSLDVYLNGVLDDGTLVDTSGSPAIPATVHGTSTATVKMGYDWIAGQNPFAGSMDDARIYNRALTAAEVKQLYLIGK